MTGPHSLRTVRVCRGIIRCPVCDKMVMHTDLQAGWAFQSCQRNMDRTFVRSGTHRGRCQGAWWALALPPDAFGGYLAGILGDDSAAALIRRAWPETKSLPDRALWSFLLNEGDEPAWVQVSVQPSERHTHRRTAITKLMHALALL